MFEKEAEKIAERKISNFIPQQWGVSLIRTEPTYETVEGAPHFYLNSLAKMWKEGAEFGYNKANEWQFVSEKGLPKDDRCVLVYREDEEPQLDYYLNEEGYWKSEKWDREYYARNGENPPVSSIIAWKEIVLPKECV